MTDSNASLKYSKATPKLSKGTEKVSKSTPKSVNRFRTVSEESSNGLITSRNVSSSMPMVPESRVDILREGMVYLEGEGTFKAERRRLLESGECDEEPVVLRGPDGALATNPLDEMEVEPGMESNDEKSGSKSEI